MKITKHQILDFLVSMLTVTGVALGTTTVHGSIIYGISIFGWWYVVYQNKAWGLIPSQIIFTLVSIWNFYETVLK